MLWLKREKTEHNVIKVACTDHFDWLMKFPRDGNYKGRLHMTYYGPLSDVHTKV